MSTYVWCEDSGSGFQFWRALFGALYPDIIVETKQSNTKLRKAAANIADDGNIYYIIMDMSLDNPDVEREYKRFLKETREKSNIRRIEVHSFEKVLLSFKGLESWIFAENDELKETRRRLLDAKALFVKDILIRSELEELRQLLSDYKVKSSEQFAAKLLYEITRNTGFETDKSKIGDCFINSCCQWAERRDDDICGLDNSRLTYDQKMHRIKEESALDAAFKEAGL